MLLFLWTNIEKHILQMTRTHTHRSYGRKYPIKFIFAHNIFIIDCQIYFLLHFCMLYVQTKNEIKWINTRLHHKKQQQQQTNRLSTAAPATMREKQTLFLTKNCRTFIKINVHLMSLFSWQSPRAVEAYFDEFNQNIFSKNYECINNECVCVCVEFFDRLLLSSLRFLTEILFNQEMKKRKSPEDIAICVVESETKTNICCYNFCELWMLVMCVCMCADWTYVRQAFFLRSSKELIYWLFVWLYSFDGFLLVYFSHFGSQIEKDVSDNLLEFKSKKCWTKFLKYCTPLWHLLCFN